ncbi:ArsR/SmtB family transcription factor [Streptomyces sp. NPDC048644]|uniref:ArsR/SmtB family transcription factor n=1 Tax=Streptomyces sp. NPDC048644 TaxID=3365582 RepID=UPI00371664C4
MAALRNPPAQDIRITDVLEALSHPLRLLVVQRLAAHEREGQETSCGEVLPEISKSTASHHWRVLRESGVVHQHRDGRRLLLYLRRADLDARFPGVLDGILAAAADDPAVAQVVGN